MDNNKKSQQQKTPNAPGQKNQPASKPQPGKSPAQPTKKPGSNW